MPVPLTPTLGVNGPIKMSSWCNRDDFFFAPYPPTPLSTPPPTPPPTPVSHRSSFYMTQEGEKYSLHASSRQFLYFNTIKAGQWRNLDFLGGGIWEY